MIIPKILQHVNNSSVDTAIIDFSAISTKDITDLAVLGKYIEDLTGSLKIMGIDVLVVGFTPEFSNELVKSGLSFVKELQAFSSFKTALQRLMKQKGLAIVSTK
ncbi:hypothetical protein [Bacillus sp. SA1-12]|uniref:hypothetical protein n=1 Tax=Bacillus sp. SA1-12 TaxID=1455638 RepID=UPI000696EED4|nr:hypothetical protein [Bacillus sp. SA1-12]